MSEWRKAVGDFRNSVSAWSHAYVNSRLSLVAVKAGGEYIVVIAQLALRTDQLEAAPVIFDLEDAFGCAVNIDGVDEAFRILDSLSDGKLSFLSRTFVLPAGDAPASQLDFRHSAGNQDGRRLTGVRLLGAPLGKQFSRERIDWRLKAGTSPMESLSDLAVQCGLGIPDELCTFECVGLNVIGVGVDSSVIGAKARIRVVTSTEIDTSHVRLGYKIFQRNAPPLRLSVGGSSLEWSEPVGSMVSAIHEFEVESNALVQAFVSYAGEAQQQYWILNPTSTTNIRLAIFAHLDRDLRVLESVLNPVKDDRKDSTSSQFEAGVAVLCTLLGFSAISLGKALPQLQDAPDHILISPKGDIAVIECTTSHIDKNDKLTQLFGRAQAIRSLLNEAGFQGRRLLAVIVTSLSVGEIAKSDTEKAHQLGISVVAKEDLKEAIRRARNGEPAQQIFDDAVVNRAGNGQLALNISSN